MIRTLLSAALGAALVATPASAQDAAADLETAAAAWVQPSNAERFRVLTEQLTAAGLDYEVQAFEGGNGRTGPLEGRNVVVTIGRGPVDIVLTAHYDAVPLEGGFSQGIVDNAGSVLAMMQAAVRLRETSAAEPFPYRYVFVFTDQEELGLIGARKWLESADRSRIAAVINADVAAYGDTVMYGENNGEQSAGLLRALRLQCAERAVTCVGFPVYPPSDDRVFSAAGLPVLSLGTQDAIGAHQMWLAFNGGETPGLREGFVPPVFQRIHSTGDVLDLFEGEDVARFGAFIADLALRIAIDHAAGG
ncbi:M28 family metallopeptidase [Brevundimonas balnearis]|uniref:M28 family metallopeptidase n=1 Tax=Brevundimonas balnearis TaxID=1572858 RepID=A0ABV6R556_9CAUL